MVLQTIGFDHSPTRAYFAERTGFGPATPSLIKLRGFSVFKATTPFVPPGGFEPGADD